MTANQSESKRKTLQQFLKPTPANSYNVTCCRLQAACRWWPCWDIPCSSPMRCEGLRLTLQSKENEEWDGERQKLHIALFLHHFCAKTISCFWCLWVLLVWFKLKFFFKQKYSLACASNIHNLSGAESWEDATVHPSPREMVVSSPTVVWNHRQSLSDTFLYGGTFYILLSSPGKIKAKS